MILQIFQQSSTLFKFVPYLYRFSLYSNAIFRIFCVLFFGSYGMLWLYLQNEPCVPFLSGYLAEISQIHKQHKDTVLIFHPEHFGFKFANLPSNELLL